MSKHSNYDWAKGFILDFDKDTGASCGATPTSRRLSGMRGMYCDDTAFEALVKENDPLVYDFYELGAPEHEGENAFGTSIVYPGMVGDEYYMTKGHFHTILDTSEVYYTLSGEGIMLTESPQGDVVAHELKPGVAVYVPRCYAHRSVNTGTQKLVTFFVFRGDAGHDYGTIEEKGFRKLVVRGEDGKPILRDNPKWK